MPNGRLLREVFRLACCLKEYTPLLWRFMMQKVSWICVAYSHLSVPWNRDTGLRCRHRGQFHDDLFPWVKPCILRLHNPCNSLNQMKIKHTNTWHFTSTLRKRMVMAYLERRQACPMHREICAWDNESYFISE